MLGFVTGLTKAVAKTVVGIPVAVVMDVVTLGGDLTNKSQSYTGKMVDGISDAVDEMAED